MYYLRWSEQLNRIDMKTLNITSLILISSFSLISCLSKSVNEFELNVKDNTSTVRIGAPEGFDISKYTDDNGYREHHYQYEDGSILYITDDIDSGSDFNEYKAKEYGENIYLRIAISDSIDIGGKHEGKYWREIKKEGIVYGYLNVPSDRKSLFDDVLENEIVIE